MNQPERILLRLPCRVAAIEPALGGGFWLRFEGFRDKFLVPEIDLRVGDIVSFDVVRPAPSPEKAT